MRLSAVISCIVCAGVVRATIPSLLDATIDDLARLLEDRITTSVELVNVYSARIKEVNDELHAITELNPTALAAAITADFERAAAEIVGTKLGLLHGIPILVKDNIATIDMNNTAGSVCMLGSKVKSESSLVTRLRKAGAIILGKTNMSEWAGARSGKNVTVGWSGYGGQCVAAYVEDQCASGSSSGSASAVSVGLAPVALGTETDGSIISPADHSNLVGIKPTMGLTSRFGVIPITHRQDTVGPMCKTVSDCARVLSVLAGKDSNDNYTSAQPFDTPPDYTKALDMYALKGARIGVPWNLGDALAHLEGDELPTERQVEAVMKTFRKSLALLEDAGATIVTANYSFLDIPQEDFWKWRSGNGTITFHADMLASINEYLDQLGVRPPGIQTLEDLISCTKHDPRERYPEVDISIWDDMVKHNYTADSAQVWQAYQNGFHLAGDGAIFSAIHDNNLDALVFPSFAAFDLASAIGTPVVTVPMGVFGDDIETSWIPGRGDLKRLRWNAPGVPFGLAFFGLPWTEEGLIGLAYAYEQRTKFRNTIKPIILPTTELPQRKSARYNDDL